MKFFIYLLLLSSSLWSYAACRSVSFSHKDASTQADFCFECGQTSSTNLQSYNIPNPSKKCFEKAISSHSITRHTYCSNGVLKRTNKKICPSKNYVNETMRSFYDVTKCLDIKKPDYFFALINRESRFQISARSSTGASCYGQLTAPAIADINSSLPYAARGDKKSCNNFVKNWTSIKTRRVRNSDGKIVHIKTKPAKCELYSNPYSCFFYSALYYKKAVQAARDLIDKLSVMVVINKKNQKLVFIDQKALNSHYEGRGEERKGIKVTKLPLVKNKEEAAQIIALMSYNGGRKVHNLYKHYMNTVKAKLWDSKYQTQMVQSLFSESPDGISSGAFLDSFSNYTRKHYGNSHGKEVAAFGKKVFEDYHNVARNVNQPACGDIPAQKMLIPKPKLSVPI